MKVVPLLRKLVLISLGNESVQCRACLWPWHPYCVATVQFLILSQDFSFPFYPISCSTFWISLLNGRREERGWLFVTRGGARVARVCQTCRAISLAAYRDLALVGGQVDGELIGETEGKSCLLLHTLHPFFLSGWVQMFEHLPPTYMTGEAYFACSKPGKNLSIEQEVKGRHYDAFLPLNFQSTSVCRG